VIRTHDLLKVDPLHLLLNSERGSQPIPGWVVDRLKQSPFVVVRSGLITDNAIPIGVRGTERSQRWAMSSRADHVERIIKPFQLLEGASTLSRTNLLPAFRSLQLLKRRWTDLKYEWGPGGSVGFELATGIESVGIDSDLDIVVYADQPIGIDEARSLHHLTMKLPAIVDVRVETPSCAFSLQEYAHRASSNILLRRPSGSMLGSDPWMSE